MPKASSCCYILFLFTLSNGNCPVNASNSQTMKQEYKSLFFHAEAAKFAKTMQSIYLLSINDFAKTYIAALVYKHPDCGKHQAGTDARCVIIPARGWREYIACFKDARTVRPYLSSGRPAICWGANRDK